MFKKIKKIMESMLWNYEVFRNLSYSWNFGVLSFLCLFIQIITGLFLAMFYVSDSNEAFSSVEHIMRDVN